MANTVQIQIHLPTDVKNRLEALARNTHRQQDGLIEQAIDRFLAFEERQLQMICEALEGAEQRPERLVEDEEVQLWIDSLDTEDELPPPHRS